eukprot:TRINITY_DN9907_c0_g1_i1.p1 TRINITY_DN9907_c0_g1~~TRINITY_DN9907_c0_g1_i1.p1  ORF type:complete len:321 (-),score=54.80 TRINITY_DN9907_c0_g1_i1:133-1095(-)
MESIPVFLSILTAIVIIACTYIWIRRKILISSDDKVVVITGCDSGFGKLATEVLAQSGFTVYATCLTENGMKDLCAKKCERIVPVRCDVTKDADVENLRKIVMASGRPLWALINNAGVIEPGLVDWMDMKSFQFCMEVNYFGVVRVTKAFLDPIKRSRGRIINVGSVAGFISAQAMSAYNGSKFAVRAFTEALRYEMLSWDVEVSLIEPSFMKTPLLKTGTDRLDALWRSLDENKMQEYGKSFYDDIVKTSEQMHVVSGDPMIVVESMKHAVMATYPRHTYKCGVDAPILYCISIMPIYIQLAILKLVMGVSIPKIRVKY